MYIFFLSTQVVNVMYFFLLNLIIIIKKICQTHGFNPTQLDPCGLDWVRLDLCDGLGWVGLNFFWPTMVGWVKKSSQPDSTRPMHTLNVCHHCGVSGHIHPNCFKLFPYKQFSKQSQVSSQGPTPLFEELLKVLNFLTQFQENSNSSMFFSRYTRTQGFSSSQPKTRAVWVIMEPKT